ncbi:MULTISPECIES: hypothetical protein [unclassified Staphylococcus]|uniref:hypothetical protein n=1 Tax=unclassified Staphylococcus TaxID=91994 RepID=UPI0021D183DB|nr:MULTISPECIES: hypothetical protein [unclassified Staphylococcus]UXR73678.1 hypothetical protein MUA48_10025 [Staphylococcus sp. IVB6238]UXR75995.1 hypothetical protein MUA74_10110 [Staphylococcus sp. IVB6233]UXR80192.1 hypothetical protein MUA65_09715 [Staphylococcus sp. IVB6218]
MGMYKKFAGLTSEPDEYQKSKIDETLALANIIGMVGLGLLTLLSFTIDMETNQISAFTIGGPILLIVIGMRSLTLLKDYTDHKYYVDTEEEAQRLKRHLKRKYFIYMILLLLYLIISLNVIAPILTGQLPYWHSTESIYVLLFIVPNIILASSIKNRVQVREDEDDEV